MLLKQLLHVDPVVFELISSECIRQENHIELIASENYVSKAVLEAQGSILTNKYAEGYPAHRYYGGCEFVDDIEELARSRLKELFKADYANVQPHSGSQANMGAYMALLNPGDKVLAMSLSHGGHLTHGSPVNFSGKIYQFIPYGVNEQGRIDYEYVRELAKTHRPKLILAGFSSYSRFIDFKIFSDIAKEVNAYFMVDMAHVAGLVATGLYPDPVIYADLVTSTTHKTLRGPRGGIILGKNNREDIGKKINSSIFPGIQGGPLMHVIAAKAVSFKEALTEDFKLYQKQVIVNANLMANVFIKNGFNVVSGGTDNHLFVLDLKNCDFTGQDAEKILDSVFITVNKNVVPSDPKPPSQTSGIRIGTPAVTTRGFKELEIELVANWICQVLNNIGNTALLNSIKSDVIELCKKFPVYPN